MARFDVTQVNLNIAGAQEFTADAHATTEQGMVRLKIALQLGPILVYCYSLRAVQAFNTCWNRARDLGNLCLPAAVDPTDTPVRGLLNEFGLVLRVNQPPHEKTRRVTGIPAKASRNGHAHVQVQFGHLNIAAYDRAAVLSWAEAWNTAEDNAKRVWPEHQLTGEQARERFDRSYIARTGQLPPS